MGAGAPGKRELPPELFARARVLCDLPEQARRMGESRHAPAGTVHAARRGPHPTGPRDAPTTATSRCSTAPESASRTCIRASPS
ncbi:hypothetical protein [Streptomyces sp. SID1034]|uniref:hypothetical protein n=1 Tax=Streptomyces sp. SID1034 TaxID=2690248 RepID=UPI001F24DA87|nr:hypothetical protein [Streptomyces sp. SID1034]